jgi:hypothetical protein
MPTARRERARDLYLAGSVPTREKGSDPGGGPPPVQQNKAPGEWALSRGRDGPPSTLAAGQSPNGSGLDAEVPTLRTVHTGNSEPLALRLRMARTMKHETARMNHYFAEEEATR